MSGKLHDGIQKNSETIPSEIRTTVTQYVYDERVFESVIHC